MQGVAICRSPAWAAGAGLGSTGAGLVRQPGQCLGGTPSTAGPRERPRRWCKTRRGSGSRGTSSAQSCRASSEAGWPSEEAAAENARALTASRPDCNLGPPPPGVSGQRRRTPRCPAGRRSDTGWVQQQTAGRAFQDRSRRRLGKCLGTASQEGLPRVGPAFHFVSHVARGNAFGTLGGPAASVSGRLFTREGTNLGNRPVAGRAGHVARGRDHRCSGQAEVSPGPQAVERWRRALSSGCPCAGRA